MNRFKVIPSKAAAFENSWRQRESQLEKFEGFRSFALLRNERPADDGLLDYISHTIWNQRADFETWRTSQEFSQAHAQGGSVEGILAGPPQVAMYEAVLEESNSRVTS
jgi:heme-degrading monooxygenase HmoA